MAHRADVFSIIGLSSFLGLPVAYTVGDRLFRRAPQAPLLLAGVCIAVYGTLCVKCPVLDPVMADPACVARLAEELTIVSPKIVVVMGDEALAVVNDLDLPARRDLHARPGELQRLTPSIEALYVPNIDEALDEESAKREFWSAFRVLGQWWADLPPY